jgi:hypothetical protein
MHSVRNGCRGRLESGIIFPTMEMKKLAGGNLRAVGYDDRRRALVVELTSGTFEYSGVTAETFRRLVTASSPWSFFRDNIDEEYPAKRLR